MLRAFILCAIPLAVMGPEQNVSASVTVVNQGQPTATTTGTAAGATQGTEAGQAASPGSEVLQPGNPTKNVAVSKLPVPTGVVLPIVLSYHPWRSLISLDALVNGNNPARFVVSTGLSMSAVAPTDIIRLQLTTSETKTHVAVLDAAADVPTATIQNIRMGAGVLHNITVAQVNLISLLTNEPMPDAPSIWLGTNWLADFQVTFDFESHAVILNRREAPFTKPIGNIVPFKLKNGRPVVKVVIPGGGSFDAVIDTGSLGTLIPSAIAIKLKEKKIDKTPKSGVDIAAGKMGRMVVPRISIGKSELKNLMVAYYGAEAPQHADKTMGIIGLDFLRRFRVTISYAKSQIQVLPPQSAVTGVPEAGM